MDDIPRMFKSRWLWGLVAILFVALMATTNWTTYTAMGAAGAATANAGAAIVFGTLVVLVSKAVKSAAKAVRPGEQAEA